MESAERPRKFKNKSKAADDVLLVDPELRSCKFPIPLCLPPDTVLDAKPERVLVVILVPLGILPVPPTTTPFHMDEGVPTTPRVSGQLVVEVMLSKYSM